MELGPNTALDGKLTGRPRAYSGAVREVQQDRSAIELPSYRGRRVVSLAPAAWDTTMLRVTGIEASGRDVKTVADGARTFLPTMLTDLVAPCVGFAIVHAGAASDWLIVGIWRDDIVHMATARATIDQTDWSLVEPGGPSMCVWEMHVVEQERQRWIELVLDRQDDPLIEEYIGDGAA